MEESFISRWESSSKAGEEAEGSKPWFQAKLSPHTMRYNGAHSYFDGSRSRASEEACKPQFKIGAKISKINFASAHQNLYNEQILWLVRGL